MSHQLPHVYNAAGPPLRWSDVRDRARWEEDAGQEDPRATAGIRGHPKQAHRFGVLDHISPALCRPRLWQLGPVCGVCTIPQRVRQAESRLTLLGTRIRGLRLQTGSGKTRPMCPTLTGPEQSLPSHYSFTR